MNHLKTYLQIARQENSPVVKNVVFGNTSADMDSVVGSILMSWFYASKTGVKYTPVVYCTRHELTFRFEILGHLSTFGIDEPFLRDNVIFKDDFQEQEAEYFAGVESVGLIDFNKLTKELTCLQDKVHYIVDHHADHKKYLETVRDKKIIICGSATTLIIQKMLTESNLFQSSYPEDISQLALFACAPLSLDSISFQEDFKVHKWIDLDQQIFEQMCQYYMKDPQEYLECCKINKYDIKQNVELGCFNNLIKNYKTFDYIKQSDKSFKGVGISSIYIPINDFIENFGLDHVVSELKKQMRHYNLGIYMIITKEFRKVSSTKKELIKEVMVFADQDILTDDRSQLQTLLAAMETDKGMKLNSKKEYIVNDRDLRLVNYQQGNIVKDRKTLDKFLKGFYNL